jgi:hypothetical protein
LLLTYFEQQASKIRIQQMQSTMEEIRKKNLIGWLIKNV